MMSNIQSNEDELWDYYSGLPNPMWYQHIEQAKEQIGRKYTHEERTELLKQAMGEERYDKAVEELMPFGGGLSEYYEYYKIPYTTIEPIKAPLSN